MAEYLETSNTSGSKIILIAKQIRQSLSSQVPHTFGQFQYRNIPDHPILFGTVPVFLVCFRTRPSHLLQQAILLL